MASMFVISFCSEAFELQDNDSVHLVYVASSLKKALSFIEDNYVKKTTNGYNFKAIKFYSDEKLVHCLSDGDDNLDDAVSFFKIEKVKFIG
jgi:hypothetical protein